MRGVRNYRHCGKDELSPRQLVVLAGLSEGMTDAEMAKALFVSESTAKQHVRDILSKLDARNRANAVHIAHRKGLLS